MNTNTETTISAFAHAIKIASRYKSWPQTFEEKDPLTLPFYLCYNMNIESS